MKTLKVLLGLLIIIFMVSMVYSFKPAPESAPPPNFCKKICGVNITTDAYLLSVDGDLYIVIVGDKSTSIIKK